MHLHKHISVLIGRALRFDYHEAQSTTARFDEFPLLKTPRWKGLQTTENLSKAHKILFLDGKGKAADDTRADLQVQEQTDLLDPTL